MTWMFSRKTDLSFQSITLMSANGIFLSNLTEDVFQVVQQIFSLDYARQLKFQSLSEEEESADQTAASVSISIPDKDELIKSSLRFLRFV